jgi:uncharacterized membrane protein YvlD (DUF360 family)
VARHSDSARPVLREPGTLLAAALLLGIVNAVVRPIAVVLTLPITLLSLGLFLLVINAAMLGSSPCCSRASRSAASGPPSAPR